MRGRESRYRVGNWRVKHTIQKRACRRRPQANPAVRRNNPTSFASISLAFHLCAWTRKNPSHRSRSREIFSSSRCGSALVLLSQEWARAVVGGGELIALSAAV